MSKIKREPGDYKMDELFTASEALSELEKKGIKIARGTLRAYVDKGEIPGIVRGHATFVAKEALEGFLPMTRAAAGQAGAKAKWNRHREQIIAELGPKMGAMQKQMQTMQQQVPESVSPTAEPVMVAEKVAQSTPSGFSLIEAARSLLNRGRGRPRRDGPDPEKVWAALTERYAEVQGIATQKRGRGRPSKETEAALEEYQTLREIFAEREQKQKATAKDAKIQRSGVLNESPLFGGLPCPELTEEIRKPKRAALRM